MEQTLQKLGTIKLTDFAMRHFDPKFGGTKILNLEPKDFESYLNKFKNLYFDEPLERWIDKKNGIQRVNILDGYAPFCKLLVMKNITDARTGSLPITLENYQYLRSGYSARRNEELPVLGRWLDLPLGAPIATYTVTILYSKEQIDKEAKAMYEKNKNSENIESIEIVPPVSFDADWGAVAILAQMTPREEPMKPITMLRNSMDITMGGSGVPLDEEAYRNSVEFWDKNATVI